MLTLPDGRTLYFSPADQAKAALLAMIGAAEHRIAIMIYSFTLADLTTLLIAKHQAGVDVRMILDSSQDQSTPMGQLMAIEEAELGGSPEAAQVARLKSAGVPLVIGKSADGQIIHSKAATVDNTRTFWGSLNFSLSAPLQCNVSCIEVDPAVIAAFEADFIANWTRLGGAA